MKRIYYTICFSILGLLSAYSQGVKFTSPLFEYGIREHLRIDASEEVTAEQLDTIRSIDLSGLGLTDIQDVTFLSHVRHLNLQCNDIRDVSPLTVLDSLTYIDLSRNQLESINVLAFSHSPRMTVDVAFNHITDFSCFQSLTSCRFTISGSSLQTEIDAPYFRTCYLYGDGTGEKAQVMCRVISNVADDARVDIADEHTLIPKDGTDAIVECNQHGTCKVLLAWGDNIADSTYVVPCTVLPLKASETVTIKTGLPGHFMLKDITPSTQGSVSISQTEIEYTANSDFVGESLLFSYYEDDMFKGVSRIVLGSDASGIRTITTADEQLTVTMGKYGVIHISCSSHELQSEATIYVYDTAGKVLAKKLVDSSHGINADLFVRHARRSVMFVQVTSGQKKFVEKILTE